MAYEQVIPKGKGTSAVKPLPSMEMFESGIIARIMREPALLKNGHNLVPGDFHTSKLGKVAKTIQHLQDNDICPDLANVCLRLDEKGELQKLGGSYFLTGLHEFESIDISGDLERHHSQALKRQQRQEIVYLGQSLNELTPSEIAQKCREIAKISETESTIGVIPKPLDFWQITGDEREKPADIIDNLLPIETILMLYGDAGIGKSLMALQWGLHLSAGRSWHNFKITKPHKVLYFLAEGGYWSLRDRIKRFSKGEVIPAANQFYLFPVTPFDITGSTDFGGIVATVEMLEPDVVMFDPLRKIHTCDENDNGLMEGVLNRLRFLVTDKKRSCIIVHHSKKFLQAERGTSVIIGDCDTVLKLEWKNPEKHDGVRKLSAEKIRHGETPHSLSLSLDPYSLSWLSVDQGDNPAVKMLADGKAISKPELVDGIVSQGISRTSAYRHIRSAEDTGLIRATPTGGIILNCPNPVPPSESH